MVDKNGKQVQLHTKISVDKDKQPIFEVAGFRGKTLLLTCVDDKGEKEMFNSNATLLLPETSLVHYEIVE